MEAHYDAAVGRYAVAFMTGLKGFNQYDIAVEMEYEYDVAVVGSGADGETFHVISIKFTDRLDDYVEFV